MVGTKLVLRSAMICLLGVLSSLWLVAAPSDAVEARMMETDVCAGLENNRSIPDGTVWDMAGSPYLVDCNIRVEASNSSLRIDAGVEVHFTEDKSLEVVGALVISGTSASPVLFTSNQANPSRGAWGGVDLTAPRSSFTGTVASASISGLEIRNGGNRSPGLRIGRNGIQIRDLLVDGSNGNGIEIDEVTGIVLTDVTLTNNSESGIEVEANSDEMSTVRLVNATIADNDGSAIAAEGGAEVHATGTTASGNGLNAIDVTSGISFDMSWYGNDLPYVVRNNVQVDAELTIEPGTVVKVGDDSRSFVVDEGNMVARGTSESPIYFTALTDDSACTSTTVDCDTNADTQSDNAAPGGWRGVSLDEDSGVSVIEHVVFRYGGYNGSAPMLSIEREGIQVLDSRFEFGNGDGAGVEEVSAEFERCTFENNNKNGIIVEGEALVGLKVHDSMFSGNGGDGQDTFAAVSVKPNTLLDISGNAVSGDGVAEDFSNDINGILIRGGSIERQIVWPAGDLPIVVAKSGTVEIEASKAEGEPSLLHIEPGAMIKMGRNAAVEMPTGGVCVGDLTVNPDSSWRCDAPASGDRTVITSINDDACSADDDQGCDTDGTDDTVPQRGTWSRFEAERISDGLFFYDAVVRYGGSSQINGAAIVTDHEKDRIENCEIAENTGSAILVRRVSAYIKGNEIHHNELHGVRLDGVTQAMTVFLDGNNIHDNDGAAVDMDANVELDYDDPDDNAEPQPNVIDNNQFNGVTVHGDVSLSSRVWAPGQLAYIITDDVDVEDSKTLTIQPGTVIKLSGTNTQIFTSKGILLAEGTEDEPIIFTSIRDSESDGSNAQPRERESDPTLGDWGGLQLGCLSKCSKLSHVEIRYSGGSDAPAVEITEDISGNVVELDSVTIENGNGVGVAFNDAGGSLTNSTIADMNGDAISLIGSGRIQPQITGNTVSGCRAVISMQANAAPIVADTDFSDNEVNGILVSGTMTVGRDWLKSRLPYVIGEKGISIEDDGALSVGAGAVIKAQGEARISVRRGGRLVIPKTGTGDEMVKLTSIRDDSVCTDENAVADDPECNAEGKARQVSAAPADWDGISLADGDSVSLAKMGIYFAGGTNTAIDVDNTIFFLSDSVIARSGGSGVEINDQRAEIRNNHFEDNTEAGLVLDGEWNNATIIEGNVFTGNGRSMQHDAEGDTQISNNVAIGNVADAMLYCAPVDSNQTWTNDLVRELDCNLDVKAKLELQPGAVLVMQENSGIGVEGSLEATGIVMTSNRSTAATPGDWDGISFERSSAGGFVKHSLLMFGGEDSSGVFDVETKSPVDLFYNMLIKTAGSAFTVKGDTSTKIEGNIVQEIQGSRSTALKVSSDAAPLFTRNRVANARNGVVATTDAQPRVNFNIFSHLSDFGVDNGDRDICVDATENWWGDASGPQDSSEGRDKCAGEGETIVNRDGQGVPVSDNVDYSSYLADRAPFAPMLDAPGCGVTNQTTIEVSGSTGNNAQVDIFVNDQLKDTVDAGGGSFEADVDLADGDHELSFEAYKSIEMNGNDVELRSPRTSFRRITVDSGSRIDPMGIRFVYGRNQPRLQPLRDVTGCATGCGGPSSGRVTLPPDTQVTVRAPVNGSANSVVFRQDGQPDRAMVSQGGYWETDPFLPAQGSFTIVVDGADADACMGFVYIGANGRVFVDSGLAGIVPPLYTEDWEDGTLPPWISSGTGWAVTDDTAKSGSWSLTDSPDGPYGTDVDQSVAYPNSFNMQDLSSPELVFYHKFAFARGDKGIVEVREGGSSGWDRVIDFGPNESSDQWQAVIVDLKEYAREPELEIRFRIDTDGRADTVADGWYIDDVAIQSGGRGNDIYDPGERFLEGAAVTLQQRNPDTGEFIRWDGSGTGQSNPQMTENETGSYGFYGLPPGEYRVTVTSDLGVVLSKVYAVWDGTFSFNVPLVGREPVYLPIVTRNAGISR